MNKILLLSLSIFTQVSCITVYELPDRKPRMDKPFIPHVKKFIKEFKMYRRDTLTVKRVRNMSILFTNLKRKPDENGNTVIAVCTRDVYNQPLILIGRKHWRNATDTRKEQVIYHELGHCVLNRSHRDTELNEMIYGKIKSSLMSSVILDDFTYESFRGYYVYELFNHRGVKYGGKCSLLGRLPKKRKK